MTLRSSFAITPGAAVSIPAGSITGTQIADGAVGTADLANDSVTTLKIVDRTILATDVAAGALTGNEIAVNSVPADRIQNLSVTAGMLAHPLNLQDQDYTGTAPSRLTGSKIDPPVRSIVQFNGTPLPAESYVNYIGTAGLLDVADDPGNNRVNVNLQGIITNAPAKGTDAQVRAVGGEPGNTVGPASAWAAADHGHLLKAVPITGQYGNLATVPFASAPGAAADATISRTGVGTLQVSGQLTVIADSNAFRSGTSGGTPLYVYPVDDATPSAIVFGVMNAARAVWKMNLNKAGTLTVNPDAGQYAINASMAGAAGQFLLCEGTENPLNARLHAQRFLELSSASGAVIPNADNALSMGSAARRWTAVYAVNGSIQTSDPAQKLGAAPVHPADALADVLATTILTYELPCPTEDDPEATMLHVGFAGDAAPARLRVGRRVKGAVTTSAEVEPNSTASMALAAIQALNAQVVGQAAELADLRARVAALEGRPA
jgi:hypothetical protein